MGSTARRQLLPPVEEVTEAPYDLRALRCAAAWAMRALSYDKMGEHPGVTRIPSASQAGRLTEFTVRHGIAAGHHG